MKHTLKVTLVLLGMFLIAQFVGIFVASQYSPSVELVEQDGELVNKSVYDLPYGLEPPEDIGPYNALFSIVLAVFFAVFLMFVLMKYKVELLLRVWFFVVVVIALAVSFNAVFLKLEYSAILALAVALPLSFLKVFKRNLLIHNVTELLVYPGIAMIFIPLLNVWAVVLLLLLISAYDIYAVWHSGFMQKMAKYQIEKVRVFNGFFVPYLGRKERKMIRDAKKSEAKMKALERKKVGVNVAILGGGDVVFPIILSGVVLFAMGLVQASLVALGATSALAVLFYITEKGKFYPAMPFISIGCLIGLGLAFLI